MPVRGVEAGVVEEAGSVSVYEGAEGEAVSPAGGHVPDVEAGVGGQLPPAPLLQGRHSPHLGGSHAASSLLPPAEADNCSTIMGSYLVPQID